MKVAKINGGSLAVMNSVTGLGGTRVAPAVTNLADVDLTDLDDGDMLVFDLASNTWVPIPVPSTTPTSMFVPVMTEDVGSGLWYVVVTGDGDAVMTEVPL